MAVIQGDMPIATAEMGRKESGGSGRLMYLLLLVSAVFYGCGFLHPNADFPNWSRWSDWSKMTDEGWYGAGAVQHFLQGHWFLAGSFNPAVAMPVWPAMLGGWFALTGVSMAWARVLTMVLYGASLVLLYMVVRRERAGTIAALAITLPSGKSSTLETSSFRRSVTRWSRR